MDEKNINYVGWLGNCNLGDSAIYLAICALFKNYTLKPYNSYKVISKDDASLFPHFEEQCSKIVMFGGGTLLPDDVTWVKPGKYNYIFGAGVKNPIFKSKYSNFNDAVIRRLKSYDFRFMGVRDYVSQQMLHNWGIPSEVIGDPALSLKARSDIKRDESLVAINIGCDGLLWGGDQERVVQEVANLCLTLKKNGYNPILIPFSNIDLPDINRISAIAKTNVFNNWYNIQSVLDLIASCKVLIGQRLHSTILSAATFTPFISLEYRPKCFQFSESVQMLDYTVRTDRVTAEQIINAFQNLVDDWSRINMTLASAVNAFREKQRIFANRIISDIASLPAIEWSREGFPERVKHELFWKTDLFMRKKFGRIWALYNRSIFLHMRRYLL